MKKNIAVLPGDGVGPEVTKEAVKILEKIAQKFGHVFTFHYGLIGATAIDACNNPLPDETISVCKNSDAILFGAIGDPKYDNNPQVAVRPEQGLLKLRKTLGLFANLRPIFVFDSLVHSSPLKPEIVTHTDFLVVRELTSGIYFGEPRGRNTDKTEAFDTCRYTKEEIIRIAKIAYDIAHREEKKVTLVDKANVLETSRLWRETVQEFSKQYPSVTTEYLFVDNASQQIIKKPTQFGVILTENMFGDILTDEASVLAGSLGLLPSASLGNSVALYEPIHGAYNKAAGKNTANPIAAILSVEMMLKYSFQLEDEWQSVWRGVQKALNEGFRTKDIVDKNTPSQQILSTNEMGDCIVRYI